MTLFFRAFLVGLIIFVGTSVFASEELIIEPDAGRAPLLAAIKQAQSSIDIVMYGFTDTKFITALVNAKKAGKNIQVLLEPTPYKSEDENTFALKRFEAANINLQTPNPVFKLTHQKTILFDQKSALILTFNLTRSTFKNERNFALLIDDPDEVQEIARVFTADWQHKNIKVDNPNLIWSPNNSREKILDFIHEAKSDIQIYAQDLSDYQTIGALAQAARTGKKVKIMLSAETNKNSGKINYLRKAGVTIRNSKQYIIHAKVILVDHDRAILGSINLTQPSMNNNRELSVITRDRHTVDALEKTFNKDWQRTV